LDGGLQVGEKAGQAESNQGTENKAKLEGTEALGRGTDALGRGTEALERGTEALGTDTGELGTEAPEKGIAVLGMDTEAPERGIAVLVGRIALQDAEQGQLAEQVQTGQTQVTVAELFEVLSLK
jgi:hypothetical protein